METVSVELPPAVAETGLSEHVALPGQPEATVKFTLPLYPFSAATLIVEDLPLLAAWLSAWSGDR